MLDLSRDVQADFWLGFIVTTDLLLRAKGWLIFNARRHEVIV